MRAVVARTLSAHVEVDGATVGALPGPGLTVLLGVSTLDGPEQAETMTRKLAELRILAGEQRAEQTRAPLLVVSQFTLYGRTARGRRPSWADAAPAERAAPLVAAVVDGLRSRGLHVETGRFGAMMRVHSVNDGPFTVLVET